MLEPVGYHSQVQPQHLQAVLPRVCQGHRLREGEHPHSSPPKNRPCTRGVGGIGAFQSHPRARLRSIETRGRPELDIDRVRERVVVSHRFPAVARLEISPSPAQFHPHARDHRKRQKLTSPPRLFPAEQLSAPCLVRYAWGKLANIRVDFVHLLDVIYTAFGVSTLERGPGARRLSIPSHHTTLIIINASSRRTRRQISKLLSFYINTTKLCLHAAPHATSAPRLSTPRPPHQGPALRSAARRRRRNRLSLSARAARMGVRLIRVSVRGHLRLGLDREDGI